MDMKEHDAYADQAEDEFRTRLSAPSNHRHAQTPWYLCEDVLTKQSEKTLWGSTAGNLESILEEGKTFKERYFRDVQFVFNRVQRHVHRRTKRGYEPLQSCRRKNCKNNFCKHNFPKQILKVAHICCAGMAKKLKLRISGRRNAFGCIVGKRSCEWQSGTLPAYAAAFGSNTHTMPGYRLPIIAESHDSTSCSSKRCSEYLDENSKRSVKLVCKLAQRVQ